MDHSGWAKGLELHISPNVDFCDINTPEASEASDTEQEGQIESLTTAARTLLSRLRKANAKLNGTIVPPMCAAPRSGAVLCTSTAAQTIVAPFDSSELAAVAEAASINIPDGMWRCCDSACFQFLTALVQEIVQLRGEVARQQELSRSVQKAATVAKAGGHPAQARSASFTRSRTVCDVARSPTNDSRGRSRPPSANPESATMRSAVRTTELSPGRGFGVRSPSGSARQSQAIRPSSPPVLSRAQATQPAGNRAAKINAAQAARPDQSPSGRGGRSSGRAGSPRGGATRHRSGVTIPCSSRVTPDARSPGFGDTEATPLGIAMVNSRPSQGSLRRSL